METSTWSDQELLNKLKVIKFGNALDKAMNVSYQEAFEILDKCAEDQSLCSFYLMELAKSPDVRNLTTESISKIKSEVNVGVSWDQKEGFKAKGNWTTNFEGNPKDLQKAQQEGVRYVEGVKSSVAKAISNISDLVPEVLSKSKNALITGAVTAGILAMPTAIISANAFIATNSPTYHQSLDNARHNFSCMEDFGSSDSNKSIEDRLVKLKKHKSAKF